MRWRIVKRIRWHSNLFMSKYKRWNVVNTKLTWRSSNIDKFLMITTFMWFLPKLPRPHCGSLWSCCGWFRWTLFVIDRIDNYMKENSNSFNIFHSHVLFAPHNVLESIGNVQSINECQAYCKNNAKCRAFIFYDGGCIFLSVTNEMLPGNGHSSLKSLSKPDQNHLFHRRTIRDTRNGRQLHLRRKILSKTGVTMP